jgi:hypothetical protein
MWKIGGKSCGNFVGSAGGFSLFRAYFHFSQVENCSLEFHLYVAIVATRYLEENEDKLKLEL